MSNRWSPAARASLTCVAACLVFPLGVMPAAAQRPAADMGARIDSAFQRWNSTDTPGCAVAVSRDGRSEWGSAYGMADLEHAVPNTRSSIFEAGSVSKQFTAAAVVLLAQDGRLSLDDDVRRFVPELPDYGTPITIRHMLTHTSGLRDWGSVAAISGWGRSARTHTHEHVIDILSRQRALNFTPGAEYSYSNSGYNLLAVVVDRVSGMSFAEFSRQRIFEPLGMQNTQWRDDYTRIVPGRTSAYAMRNGRWVIDRPIENVHGNGGLLTTVDDLLIWNDALADGRIGGPQFVQEMHRQGVLNDGEQIDYASGIVVSSYRGVPEISHTGATSGYRAVLARYPDQRVGVAVLCNAGNADPGSLGHLVADAVLGEAIAAPEPARPRAAPADRPAPVRLTAAELEVYAGEYYSPDAETTLQVLVEDGRLVLLRRPGARMALAPAGRDEFSGGLGTIRFIRDSGGAVTELSVSQGRVFDLRFDRR